MRVLLTASLFALGFSAYAPGSALADTCGRVTTSGLCEDAKTLVFCEDGGLVRVECPVDELCVIGDERFAGVAACVATALAACDDLSEVGACAGARSLVYCDERGAHEERCGDGTSCDWVDDENWFACVPDGDARPDPVPETPGQDDPVPESPGTEPPVDTAGASPSVSRGGAPPAEEFIAGGSGCAGGASTGLVAMIAGALVALRSRSRRRV